MSIWEDILNSNKLVNRQYGCILEAGDGSFKFLPYQLSMVGYWPTMVTMGNRELGFDSGEGA